jgi:hypothetical protein
MESMKNDVGMRWEMYDFSDLVNDILVVIGNSKVLNIKLTQLSQ